MKPRLISGTVIQRRRCAFTVVELMVVGSVILVLVSILLPAVRSVRDKARRVTCSNNLVQIGIALHTYEMSFGVLPPGTIDGTSPVQNVGTGYHMSWTVQILPHNEQAQVFSQISFLTSAYSDENAAIREMIIPVYRCPDESFRGENARRRSSSYAGSTGGEDVPLSIDNRGVLFQNSSVGMTEINDGATNTIMVAEKRFNDLDPRKDLGWMSGTGATLRNTGIPINAAEPFSNPESTGGFGSHHPEGTLSLNVDGSVRYLSEAIDESVLKRLGNRDDVDYAGGF